MFPITPQLKGLRHIAAIFCFTTLAVTLVPKADADLKDKKTIVTFSAPVEVPGKVLPAGTYVFKVLDSTGNRNVLQIFDKDEKHLEATILTVPDYRPTTPEKPVINFEERSSDSPPALKAWFYPDDNYGWEFVYPHKRAVELAKRTNQNVLSMNDSMSANMANPNKSASDTSVQEMKNTDVTGVGPGGEPVALEIIVQTQPAKK
jgi:hypothetical protein